MSLSAKARAATPAKNFAGPHHSFPVNNAHEVHAAVALRGHAANPGAVLSRVKAIAARLHLSGALPKSVHPALHQDTSSHHVYSVERQTGHNGRTR